MSFSDLRAGVESDQKPLITAEQPPNYYCLEPGHAPQLIHRSRFFYADPDVPGAPICPVCTSLKGGKDKRVSATAVDNDSDYPEGFRDLAGRLQQEVED